MIAMRRHSRAFFTAGRFSTTPSKFGRRRVSGTNDKKVGEDDLAGTWASLKREVGGSSANESIGRIMDEMRERAKQTRKLADNPNFKGYAEVTGGAYRRLRHSFDRTRAAFSSSFDTIKQKFAATVESNVNPKFAASTERATNAVRNKFRTLISPFSNGSHIGKTMREIAHEVFGTGPNKAYSQREKSLNPKHAQERVISDRSELVTIVEMETEWAKRLRQVREKAERSESYQAIQTRLQSMKATIQETPVYKKSVEVQEKVADKIEDVRDAYDTTQNPIVWTLRDGADQLFAESEQAAALAAIRRIDIEFSLPSFMEEMEHYMIPAVVKAYLRGDIAILRQACGGDAMKFVNSSIRQRQAQNAHFDERILDVSNVVFQDAIVLETGDPVLVMTFRCQHVHCLRGPSPERRIIEGSDHDIRSTFYSWAVAPDPTNPEFNWRILDMQIQGIRALI